MGALQVVDTSTAVLGSQIEEGTRKIPMMHQVWALALVIGVAFGAHNNHTNHHNHHQQNVATTQPPTTLDPRSDKERIAKLESTLTGLARQVMLQQLFVEERIRSDGDSGIKQLRGNSES